MTTRVRRAPGWLPSSIALTAASAAVSLCLLLIGLTRMPHVAVGDTFQFLPRAAHASSVSSVQVPWQQWATGDSGTTVDGDPPDALLATPPSWAHPGPHLIRLSIAAPASATCLTRSVGTVGCRGPPA